MKKIRNKKSKRRMRNLVIKIYAVIAFILFGGSFMLLAGVEETVKLYNTDIPVLGVFALIVIFFIGGWMLTDLQDYIEKH